MTNQILSSGYRPRTVMPPALTIFGSGKIVNLSIWDLVDALHNYVYRSAQVEIMRGKNEWFQKMDQAFMVFWWVPAGYTPSIQ
ncbi:DUF3291 domain-containing protein [Marinobacter nauticus]|nr:DUF3291 domain-containing protein [Marinobacter nauticus]